MLDKNKEFLDYITYWTEQLGDFPKDSEAYRKNLEIAIFKFYVKAEKLILDYFSHYFNDGISSSGCTINRRIKLTSSELQKFLQHVNKKYLSLDDIKRLYDFFFDKGSSFETFFQDATMATALRELKYIRNYIAHESDESKKTYVNYILNNKDFIEPGVFLMKKRGRTKETNYEFFVSQLTKIPNFLY